MNRAFISFRSTSYKELLENGCIMVSGKVCNKDNALKCRYERCSFRRAVIFANQQKAIDCFIVPPKFILPPNALLTSFNYFEYLPDIKYIIENSDFFVRFELEEDSFWTEMELNFWKSHCRKTGTKTVIVVTSNGSISEEKFSPMDKTEAQYYWRLMYYTRKENYHDHAWGRFSNCFVQICPSCGNMTLVSAAALRYMINHNISLVCPHCNINRFSYCYKNKMGLYFFDCTKETGTRQPIPTEQINELLLKSHKRLLAKSPLVCMSNESFPEQIALIVMIHAIGNWVRKSIVGGHLELRIWIDDNGVYKIPMVKSD